ncbi:MAG: ribbon-helix-helix protein, CopG family [Alistipes sp.]|nr:ribbon-helix-helix protein, CopG family [Alistipes sp.]
MKKKITVTVEADVAATLEQKARERGVSRGRLIEYLIHAAWDYDKERGK